MVKSNFEVKINSKKEALIVCKYLLQVNWSTNNDINNEIKLYLNLINNILIKITEINLSVDQIKEHKENCLKAAELFYKLFGKVKKGGVTEYEEDDIFEEYEEYTPVVNNRDNEKTQRFGLRKVAKGPDIYGTPIVFNDNDNINHTNMTKVHRRVMSCYLHDVLCHSPDLMFFFKGNYGLYSNDQNIGILTNNLELFIKEFKHIYKYNTNKNSADWCRQAMEVCLQKIDLIDFQFK
jgi:hypothetical protein